MNVVLRAIGVALLVIVGGLASARTAAEYLAADGFGAPERVVQLSSQTAAALALDNGTPVVYWYDPAGVYRRTLTGASEQQSVFSGRGVRGVAAATVDGDPAVLRVVRDFQTGRSAHVLAWRGEERTVVDALEVLPVAIAEGPAGPTWLVRSRASGRGLLVLDGWRVDPIVVRDTGLSLAGYDLAIAPDGSIWVGWLEGRTERSAFGVTSNWSSYIARVDAAGNVGPSLSLGKSLRRSDVDRLRIALGRSGEIQVVWPNIDGALVGTTIRLQAADDSIASAVRTDAVLGPGIAVGIVDEKAYWADADRILERSLTPGSDARAVLWAPHSIQSGDVVSAPSGDVFLAWYGGALAGTYAVYAAGTASPFEPTWLDRVAAAMDWNPWNLWSEALGQLLASLLAALLVTMAVSPVLWLGSAIAVRYGRFHDGTWTGIGIGAAVILLAVGIVRLRISLPPDMLNALFGMWWHMALGLGVAVVVTWLASRGRDTEPLLGTLVAAASCTGLTTLILAFTTYQAWATSWTGFL